MVIAYNLNINKRVNIFNIYSFHREFWLPLSVILHLTYGNLIIQDVPNRGFVLMVENMPANDGGGCSGCSGGCGH